MKIGDKVKIIRDGMNKASIDAMAVSGIHPKTIEYYRDCCSYNNGDIGIVEDLNAEGKLWKIIVNGYKELQYVPISDVELLVHEKSEEAHDYWLKIWNDLDEVNGLRKLYYGEKLSLPLKDK